MSITADSKHEILLPEASKLTSDYRKSAPKDSAGNYLQPIAYAFGRNEMIELLNQNNAIGFRIYLGMDAKGQITPVITAIDEENNDLYNEMLLDMAQPCPDICSNENPLNKD